MIRRAGLLLAALAAAGCNGGTVDRHDLTKDAGTLDSISCEGALLANGVARGRTTVFYAREQAEELRVQSANLADALSRRPTVPSIEQRVRKKSRDASAVAAVLHRLQDHADDRSVGAEVERALKKAGNCK